MEDLAHMLNAINVALPVDADKFESFAADWLDRFHNSKISWCTLTPSVHALLHHGAQIIRYFPIPIGLMSEEGAEERISLPFDFYELPRENSVPL